MTNVEVRLTPDQPALLSDLQQWLKAERLETAPIADAYAMGPAELTLIAGASGAILRGALSVVREWANARRSNVTIRTSGGSEFIITSTASLEEIEKLVTNIKQDNK